MIISIHIPRTAGSNFRTFLLDQLKDNVLLDYRDPILVNTIIRNTVTSSRKIVLNRSAFDKYKCIHGHFMPHKYSGVFKNTKANYVIWLRDPVDRIVSHYYFLKSDVAENKNKSPFQAKVIREDWSLEAFCFNKTIQNLVSKILWNFPIEKFSFIGLTHNYEQDIIRFSTEYFSIKRPYIRKAVNKNNMFTSYEKIDESFRASVMNFHEKDAKLYQAASLLRNKQTEAFELNLKP